MFNAEDYSYLVIFHENTYYVSRCLEFDLIIEGRTLKGSLNKCKKTVADLIKDYERNDEALPIPLKFRTDEPKRQLEELKLSDMESVDEFLRMAYDDRPSDAERLVAEAIDRAEDWGKMNLLSGLGDFNLWPTSELLMSKIRECLLSENALVFVCAAQIMIRGNIPFNGIEESLSEKRLLAISNLRAQFSK